MSLKALLIFKNRNREFPKVQIDLCPTLIKVPCSPFQTLTLPRESPDMMLRFLI
jgi:hypothetical protein